MMKNDKFSRKKYIYLKKKSNIQNLLIVFVNYGIKSSILFYLLNWGRRYGPLKANIFYANPFLYDLQKTSLKTKTYCFIVLHIFCLERFFLKWIIKQFVFEVGDHCKTLYTTQRKQYVFWSDQSNHMVGTQQESGSEMRNLALKTSFVTYRTCYDCRLSRW